jgi:hypothetical protein
MVTNEKLLIALDRSGSGDAHNLLYIDANGDGNLKDETPAQAYQTDSQHAYFGPVKVTLAGADGPGAYHLNFRLCDHGRPVLYATSAGWYEGTVTVAGVTKHCVLVDYNSNGTFNDQDNESLAFDCDRIRIGAQNNRDIGFVGKYVEVDGVLYKLEVARDGAFVKLAAAEDVAFGSVILPESISEFAAAGANGLFVVKPKEAKAQLPVGKYRIHHWAVERKAEKGDSWKMEGRNFGGESGIFEITEKDQAKLDIGEPVESTLDATKDRNGYRFSQNLKGRMGERITITQNGKQPRAPQLHIRNSSGNYDKTFTFEYG